MPADCSRLMALGVTGALVAAVMLMSPASAATPKDSTASLSGDVRTLMSGLDSTNREGVRSEVEEGVLRFRIGGNWRWNDRVSLVGRFATSAATSGNRWRLGRFESAQTSSGLESGAATLDLAHVAVELADGLQLRFGRFQDSLALPAVPDKSLDRKDSDSVSISYTDGVSFDWSMGRGWSLLGIAQYNPHDGATNRPRAPLTFVDSESRVSGFFALRKAQANGLWALRSLNLTVLPSALPASHDTRTYLAAVGNFAMRWPAKESGMHALIGGSLGYAPDVPPSARQYSQPQWAWQATANLMNFASLRQSIGIVWMRAGAGWLLSPDLASNTRLREIRYRISPLDPLTLEIRFRYRSDDETVLGASSSQEARDWYLRATWRF